MSLPSAAKTPVRSVRTPRVMVLPSTPTSVVTSPELPPPPLEPLLSALVLQPLAATTTAAPSSATARAYFPVLISSCSLALDDRTGWWCSGKRRRRGTALRHPPQGEVVAGGSGRGSRPGRRAGTGSRGRSPGRRGTGRPHRRPAPSPPCRSRTG